MDARAVDRRVDELVSRCLAVSNEPASLRIELSGLAAIRSQRAEFAYCLFSLDLARQGEAEAKASFARHTGILLEAHRDPDLTRYLLGENRELAERWASFVPLLLEFERRLNAAPPPSAPLEPVVTAEQPPEAALDVAIAGCFAARGDLARLRATLDALSAFPESPRRELAVCLFELELVRLGAEEAKPEFAQRTALLLEAYRDPERARALIGESSELKSLWDDLVPYLEEFFEPPEDDYEVVEEVVEVGDALEVVEPTTAEEEALEFQIDVDVDEPRPAPPPPPPNITPAPGRIPAVTPGIGRIRRVSSQSYRRLSIPPPPAPPPSSIQPGPETLAFWAHAEKELELLPDENGQLSGKQAFDLHARDQRTKLKRLASEVVQRFSQSPEARALGCLIELYLAAGQKEKTLFGKPSEKRQLAVQDALSLLTRDPVAAGHAAVLFENDGPETREAFGEALVLVQRFLGFCARNALDPLASEAVQKFKA